MRKIINYTTLLFFLALISLILTLSTIGIETNKFNQLITSKAAQTKNVLLQLNTVKFKINPKELSLFLETQNPEITYRKVSIPVQNIKVYIDFLSLLKSDLIIKKTIFSFQELDITQLNKLSIIIKPSNFKSLLNNKIKAGKLVSEIEIFLDKNGSFENFIARGKIEDLRAELFSDFNFSELNLGFTADKNDILIKNIFGKLEDINISEGDIKLNLENGIKINSNFNSKFYYNESLLPKYKKFLDKINVTTKIKDLKANLSNNLFIDLDETYKVKDYKYNISGKLEKGKLELINPIKNKFITEEISEIYLSDFQISSIFKPKNIELKSKGKYSFNNLDFLKIDFDTNYNKNKINLQLDFDYKNDLAIELINFKKSENSIANFSFDIQKNKNNFEIKKLNFKEKKNLIEINNLVFLKNNFKSFKKVKVFTQNNDFSILNEKKILIKGNKFDATNLAKFLSGKNNNNSFKKINNIIEIDFKNITVPMSEKLQNFKLIGEINKGKFVKISSKGDFGGNNFLDISMKKDKNTEKKYLEIYSDLPRPLLAEYSFFKGLSGGKLLFTSIIDEDGSNSKLKIENFKVVNAPGVVKLLSLADLGGLADLAMGDGLTFEVLEIDISESKNFLKINEMLALGPSMSVLIEGYQDENEITSLRGTLVPAKTLNKLISKIPIIGNIVIPKEVGEGLFGISFKMKGPKGKIKTTINPIRTITPRFIQKIIEKNKTTK